MNTERLTHEEQQKLAARDNTELVAKVLLNDFANVVMQYVQLDKITYNEAEPIKFMNEMAELIPALFERCKKEVEVEMQGAEKIRAEQIAKILDFPSQGPTEIN